VRLAGGQAGQQRVELCAGECPLKPLGNLAVALLEGADACGERLEVFEVVRRQCLALQDREVDLDLVQPRRSTTAAATASKSGHAASARSSTPTRS
jgi:hypothetical protein